LGREVRLQELENPLRVGVVGRGTYAVVVRWRSDEIGVVAGESVGDVRRCLGTQAPVRLEVGDNNFLDPETSLDVLE
jgi:hypothetical protein